MTLQKVIRELKQMTQGGVVYFKLADAKGHLEKLDSWPLRHLRKIQWQQWKTARTRFNKLLAFKVNRNKVARVAWGRAGPGLVRRPGQ